MSVFSTQTVPCPACKAPVEVELALRVEADGRPDLRQAILDGSLQRIACPACGARFRVEPAFTFVDRARGQYIGVWPFGTRPEWRDYAERTRQGFDAMVDAGGAAGAVFEARVVFGWAALVEKLLAREAGIDDRTLELAKVVTLRHGFGGFEPGQRELRLVGVGEAELVLAWVGTVDGAIGDGVRVPRAIVGEIEAEPEAWQALREQVVEGLVVDFQRDRLPA